MSGNYLKKLGSWVLTALLFLFAFSCSKNEPNEEPLTVPTISTRSAFDVTSSGARAGGTILFDGGTPVSERGVCYSKSPNPTISDPKSLPASGVTTYECFLSGLDQSTTYYYKAYAKNSVGVGYGEQKSFTTLGGGGGGLANVSTAGVSSVTETSVVTGGQVTTEGGSPVTARGVCWSGSLNPSLSDAHTTNGSGPGVFTSNLTGLTPATTYYVRAYAVNTAGTAYGNQVEFVTSGGGGSGQPCPGLPSISDPRDGQSYPTVQIGSQCWLRKNMNFSTGNSWCYDNNTANCTTYGRLYDWSAALGACPPGWHLPTTEEYTLLADFLVAGLSGTKMKSTTGWYNNGNGTNESGFTALPGGIRNLTGGYEGLTQWGIFWTSTSSSADQAWIRMLEYNTTGIGSQPGHKNMGRSVRCVRDY